MELQFLPKKISALLSYGFQIVPIRIRIVSIILRVLMRMDVYLNVAGGLKINEPAADLAVAAALLSAREDLSLPAESVVFGEISLSGALRPVVQSENRLKEAQKLGFSKAIIPAAEQRLSKEYLELSQFTDLSSFVGDIFGAG